jgi:2-polyprenyl-6-hydroxyphenyl methylase/3-demethylubiquinone-9 3-methyltransferase
MKPGEINNKIYDELGNDWYESKTNPVALLRSESKEKIKFVESFLTQKNLKMIDVGCGAGFVANYFSNQGHDVTGVDLSEESLAVAKNYDQSGRCHYVAANAYQLPFPDQSFDVCICFDFLEHVEEPEKAVAEISRVLKPGGQFFYHTFNQNWLAWLVIIKGVEWFVPNTPANMHVLKLFIKPQVLQKQLERNGFTVNTVVGLRPLLNSSFWKLIFKGEIDDDFHFRKTNSLLLSYLGFATKKWSLTAQLD